MPRPSTLPQVAIGAVVILMILLVAAAYIDTWNTSVTPTLSEEGQKQTKQIQDNFWGGIVLLGIGGGVVVVIIVLRATGKI